MRLASAGGERTASLRTRGSFIWAHYFGVIALLVAVMPRQVDAQDDEYLRIYEKIEQADSLDAGGKTAAALTKYREAHADLLKLRRQFPSWNREMVSYRLNYAATKTAACNDKLKPVAADAGSSTQPVNPGPASRNAPAQMLSKVDKPIVRLLDPGAEPRKVLRLQPKAGDKQIVALTMKLAMDPGPLTNLPPVVMTTRITIKDVSPNGDIRYERVITDVNVPDGSGPAAPDMKLLKPDFSRLKGLTTSGVTSSRGLSISERTQTKSSKPGEVLPAIVRLFRMKMDEALNIIAAQLPLEAVGAGAKWEVTPAAGSRDEVVTAVYEVVSIEQKRVTARTTVTVSATKQTPKGLAVTGGGSGEMTLDLARIMPAKGNLVYRVEASESDPAGGPKGEFTMKIGTDLRIEAK